MLFSLHNRHGPAEILAIGW